MVATDTRSRFQVPVVEDWVAVGLVVVDLVADLVVAKVVAVTVVVVKVAKVAVGTAVAVTAAVDLVAVDLVVVDLAAVDLVAVDSVAVGLAAAEEVVDLVVATKVETSNTRCRKFDWLENLWDRTVLKPTDSPVSFVNSCPRC